MKTVKQKQLLWFDDFHDKWAFKSLMDNTVAFTSNSSIYVCQINGLFLTNIVIYSSCKILLKSIKAYNSGANVPFIV